MWGEFSFWDSRSGCFLEVERQISRVAIGPGKMPRARLDDDTPQVRLVAAAPGGECVDATFPCFAAGAITHDFSKFVKLADHHQERNVGGNGFIASRHAAPIK